MPPNIHFDHSSTYSNNGLAPSGPFKVGQSTSITVSLINDGDRDGNANVLLWWCGPTAGAPAGTHMDLLSHLDPPDTSCIFTVSATTHAGQKTVAWTPKTSDFPDSLGSTIHGCLFGQAEILPIPPDYPGDNSAIDNWDPNYSLCAQHNIDIVTISPPSPSPKPVHYALGIGHGLTKTVDAEITVEKLPMDHLELVSYVSRLRETEQLSRSGRSLMAADVKIGLGVERLWVPNDRRQRPVLRLGHTGRLDPAVAKKLAGGKRGKAFKVRLDAGELRQAVVDITPPKGAKRGDCFAVGIVNAIAPTSAKSKRRRILGTLTVIVQIAKAGRPSASPDNLASPNFSPRGF